MSAVRDLPFDDRDSERVLGVIRGREPAFEEGDYYEATIKVRMHVRAGTRDVDGDLRTVADRAALAAAGAYNFHSTRITAVRLVTIEADRGG